ncbi:MAG: envelope stress response membrane protein PspB [Halioglobus sp.]
MTFWNFMSVPTILFLTVVAPIWIIMHYRSVNRSSRSLNQEDRESIEHMLVTVDKLTDRIGALEAILDADHPQWRQQVKRQERDHDTDAGERRNEEKA